MAELQQLRDRVEELQAENERLLNARELKKLVRDNAEWTILDVRREATRWVEEGQTGRDRSHRTVAHNSEVQYTSQCPAARQALKQCERIKAVVNATMPFRVRVQGKAPICLKPGALTMVPVSCPHPETVDFLLEPPSFEEEQLPEGLLMSPTLVCARKGLLHAPVVNVNTAEVWLPPRRALGTVQAVKVAPVQSTPITVSPSWEECCAYVSAQEVSPPAAIPAPVQDFAALTQRQAAQAQSLFDKYSTIFSQSEANLGCTSLITHEIPLLDDAPVRQPYRRIPPSQYEVVKAHIQQLLDSQVIRESSSPYSSPIVLVTKKDGSLRLCVDYRQLNTKTRRDAYPLPRIEESLDALSGAKWFSTLDLASGYHQVPVAEKDKYKTAFCTPFGLFEFNRMAFGLCNAPSTFQRLMERIFGDCRYQSVLLYLDDVIVFSSTVEQHLERLEEVFRRLEKQGLKAKLSKCKFFQREVSYLGHVVSAEGVSTDPVKIEVVKEWRRPGHLAELRSFLGFASYYRRFVEGFSKLAAPLHQLKPFILEVDASHGGLGAILSQEHGGKVRPVAFASRGLKPTERNMENYSSMKLELLAVKWAVTEKFREYLLGNQFTILTDNNPLSHLQTAKLGALEQRWASQLASFNFVIKYRPGRSNQNADALSRQYLERFTFGTAVPGLGALAARLRGGPEGTQVQPDIRPWEWRTPCLEVRQPIHQCLNLGQAKKKPFTLPLQRHLEPCLWLRCLIGWTMRPCLYGVVLEPQQACIQTHTAFHKVVSGPVGRVGHKRRATMKKHELRSSGRRFNWRG
ncbi:hypothetical protein ACEWY4_028049 [Coilia grayii]|uniref:ribonuclease H n=1 Tax=Coilia grayii TaxID=363190 RepID=A0ABD1IMY2_9TELE